MASLGTVPLLAVSIDMDRLDDARYRAINEHDLGWSVIDTFTGHVMLVRDLPMLCLSERAAKMLADYANRFGDLILTLH